MNPERREELQDKVYEFMGKKHYSYLYGAANSFNSLGKILFGRKPKAHCFLVDNAKIAELKAAAKAEPGAPERLSTNDVLTSAYGKASQARLLIMAADFKGRIEGTTHSDAAQYHAALIFDPEGYAAPASIREALAGPPPLSRARLPGFCGSMGARLGLITSWASLKSLRIPACELHLHTPCEATSGMIVAAQDDTCIVFNPQPGKIAMLCVTKQLSAAQLMAAMPFEGPLAPNMWSNV